MYKVCIQRGRYAEPLAEAPVFETRGEAEAWAKVHLEANPTLLRQGLEGLSVMHSADPALQLPNRPRDTNQLAKLVVDLSTGQLDDAPESVAQNPMSELGRSGGLKGGRARADKLSSERRAEIAREAAAARWRKDDR